MLNSCPTQEQVEGLNVMKPLYQASPVMYSMRSREYDVAGAASASPSLNASTYSAYWTIRGELS